MHRLFKRHPTVLPIDLGILMPSLYVIQINVGRIKVGYSNSPGQRLAQHRDMAHAFGCRVGYEWTSVPRAEAPILEQKLIQFCERYPGMRQYRREYFDGVPFEAAVRYAAELCEDEETLRWLAARDRRLARVGKPRNIKAVPQTNLDLDNALEPWPYCS